MKLDLKTAAPYIIAILAIVIVNIFFFLPQFEGKVVRQGDIVQHGGMSHEAVEYQKRTGEPALWTNSMFSGMPAYQISTPNDANLLKYVEGALTLGFPRPAGYFITGMLGMFLLFNLLGVNVWLSLLGALLFGFTTNNLVLFEAGHNSKVMAIMTSPLVIAGVIVAYRKHILTGGILFGIAFGLNILCNHPQMTYYLGLSLAILVIFEGVRHIREGKIGQFAAASGLLLLMSIVGIGASAGKIWPTYEYTQSTMRGGQVLKAAGESKGNADSKGGLEWDYAMGWSNGIGDVLATFVPKAVGGGSGEWVGKDSKIAKAVGQRQELQVPTYWGSLPFTSGPSYYGIVAFFLFVFGAFAVKGDLKWWLIIAFLFTTLMSMGKHFEGFNKLLFDTLPMLNKFRAPSSILSITAIFIPILGILGLQEIVNSSDRKAFLKPLYISLSIVGGICAILWLLGGSLFDFVGSGDSNYAQIIDALDAERRSMLAGSAMRSLLFTLFTGGALYLFLSDKIKLAATVTVISLLTLLDIFPISKDYFDKKDFVNKSALKKDAEERPVDTQIKADKDPHYRVFDVTGDPFNSALAAHHHKLIGGYHPAKLQRYQDLIEHHISQGNMGVLSMLNTKYIIKNGPDENPAVQQNPMAFGNAWFADSIIMVADNNAEIDSLKNLGFKKSAIVHNEFKPYVDGLKYGQPTSTIKLTSYNPNKIEYDANASADQLAVFSEIWYGPDKGWQAYVDGKEVDHIRVNYVLRALKVPSGQHKITFEFKPRSYYMGNTIGMICSSILLIGLLFLIWRWWNREKSASM